MDVVPVLIPVHDKHLQDTFNRQLIARKDFFKNKKKRKEMKRKKKKQKKA